LKLASNRENFIMRSNISTMVICRKKWTGHVARMGVAGKDKRENFLGKSDEQGTLRTARPRWEDNIKVHFKGIWREVLDWTYLAQGGG
jgi:hypothetical protein